MNFSEPSPSESHNFLPYNIWDFRGSSVNYTEARAQDAVQQDTTAPRGASISRQLTNSATPSYNSLYPQLPPTQTSIISNSVTQQVHDPTLMTPSPQTESDSVSSNSTDEPPPEVGAFYDAIASTQREPANKNLDGAQALICVGTTRIMFTVPEHILHVESSVLSYILLQHGNPSVPLTIFFHSFKVKHHDDEKNINMITLPDISPATFAIISYYLFESKIPEAEVTSGNIEGLADAWILSKVLQIPTAATHLLTALAAVKVTTVTTNTSTMISVMSRVWAATRGVEGREKEEVRKILLDWFVEIVGEEEFRGLYGMDGELRADLVIYYHNLK